MLHDKKKTRINSLDFCSLFSVLHSYATYSLFPLHFSSFSLTVLSFCACVRQFAVGQLAVNVSGGRSIGDGRLSAAGLSRVNTAAVWAPAVSAPLPGRYRVGPDSSTGPGRGEKDSEFCSSLELTLKCGGKHFINITLTITF